MLTTPHTPTPDDPLGEAIAAYLAAVDSGRPIDREALLSEYPDVADQLRSFLAVQERLDRICQPLREAVPADDRPGPEGRLPLASPWPRVPGYEILGELGRGGMGVVYQARQVAADRLVALKMVLTGGHAGPDDLARFRTEAEAAARLAHPNIVQVFEVGEAAGLPFFALEYVGGGSLDRVLKGTPLPPRAAAELIETLSRAMQTAHEANVVHRDLKPANVLLTFSRDAERSAAAALRSASRLNDGAPKIADFGLARKLDDAGQTQTGAILGTPSYMAPEQAQGQKVGPLADVYALGAILYECLTGRPPFKAATPLDTILQVIADEPVPPRQLNPAVPRDLETICLKCLQKEPGKRYPAAAALAEDLRRFLDGLPVSARPASWLERLAKWTRRRPAAAALIGVAVAAPLAVAAVSLAYSAELRRANSELNTTNEKLDTTVDELTRSQGHLRTTLDDLSIESKKAVAARDRAERRFRDTMETIDQLLVRVGDQRLARLPGFEEERRRILEDAYRLCRRLLDDEGPDRPRLRRETALTQVRSADVQRMLGRLDDAEKDYRAALALLNQEPPDDEREHLLALAELHLGKTLEAVGRYDDAEKSWLACVGRLSRLHRPRDGPRLNRLAALSTLGRLYYHTGRTKQAEDVLGQAIDAWEAEYQREPRDATALLNLSACSTTLVNVLSALGQHVGARDRARRTVQHLSRSKLFRQEPALIEAFALSLAQVGQEEKKLGRPDRAQTAYGDAIGLLDRYAAEAPSVPTYRLNLAIVLNNSGLLARGLGRHADAAAAHQKALRLSEELAGQQPGVPAHIAALAASLHSLGDVQHNLGRHREAAAALSRAVELREKLARYYPDIDEHHDHLSNSYNSRALVCLSLGQGAEAVRLLVRARDVRVGQAKRQPRFPENHQYSASARSNLAAVYLALGRSKEALDEFALAHATCIALTRAHPTVAEYRHSLTTALNNLGEASRRLGQFADAERYNRQAVDVGRALVRDRRDVPGYRATLALSLNNLAYVYLTLGKMKPAQETFALSLQIREELAKKYPGVLAYRMDLAKSHSNLGAAFSRITRADLAGPPTVRAVGLRRQLAKDHADVPAVRLDLASSLRNLASLQRHELRYADTEKTLLESLALVQGVLKQHPDIDEGREGLEETYRALGELYDYTGPTAKAEAAFGLALRVADELIRLYPDAPDHRYHQAEIHSSLASLYGKNAQVGLAEKHFRLAIQAHDELRRRHPTAIDYMLRRANTHDAYARLLHALNRNAEAEAQHKKAIAIIEPVAKALPESTAHQVAVSACYLNLGNVYRTTNRFKEAQKIHVAGLRIAKDALEQVPDSAVLRHVVATSFLALGRLYEDRGRFPSAILAYTEGIKLSDPIAAAHPDMIEFSIRNGAAKLNLGNIARRQERHADAIAWYTQVVSRYEAILPRAPKHVEIRTGLCGAYVGRAISLSEGGRHAEAAKDWGGAFPLAPQPEQGRQMHVQRLGELLKAGDPLRAAGEVGAVLKGRVDFTWLIAAEVHADASTALTRAGRRAEAEKHAARAVELLRLAWAEPSVARKMRSADLLTNDPFEPLRGRDDFKQFLDQVKKREAGLPKR